MINRFCRAIVLPLTLDDNNSHYYLKNCLSMPIEFSVLSGHWPCSIAQTTSFEYKPHNYLLTIARGLTVDLFQRRTLEKQCIEALMEIDAMLYDLGKKTKQTFILS
jgi:hypothetical protein